MVWLTFIYMLHHHAHLPSQFSHIPICPSRTRQRIKIADINVNPTQVSRPPAPPCIHMIWSNDPKRRNTTGSLSSQLHVSSGHQPAHGGRLPHELRRHCRPQAHDHKPQSRGYPGRTPSRHSSLSEEKKLEKERRQKNRILIQISDGSGKLLPHYSLSLCTSVFSTPPL